MLCRVTVYCCAGRVFNAVQGGCLLLCRAGVQYCAGDGSLIPAKNACQFLRFTIEYKVLLGLLLYFRGVSRQNIRLYRGPVAF